ncbi:NACHT domain-containing protein [Actinocrispum sp. NPDC049592]|uniref:NACHT domain-containing protein n=1 Tax=Actinocrispum sp. NPDC049592 TaxID=3154835 RepID=UPI0034201F5C
MHRTILVVDIEGFSDRRRTNRHQVAVRDGLYRVLEVAFAGVGMRRADWRHEDRGDGVFILVTPNIVKSLFVESLPAELVRALHEHNRTHCAEERIRLRMALHAGEVNYDEHGTTAAAINLAFRLLDAQEVRRALATSPGVLVVATSSWFFDEVVRHSPASRPDTYRPVDVRVKNTRAVVWIARPDHPYTSSRGAPAPEPRQADSDCAGEFAEAIRRQWTDEAAARMLNQPEPLPLQWSTTTRAVAAQPRAVLGGTVAGRPLRLRLHGRLDEIVDAFLQLPHRQLVVLGEPGAGKTALAILLTLGLLDRRRTQGGQVPVLLSAASWHPNREHVDVWVTQQLIEDYPALAKVDNTGLRLADRLVAEGAVLPILDGVDEMSPPLRPVAIAALDRTMTGGRPFVVTCRSVEYQAAIATNGRVLSNAAVIEINPVDTADALTYLSNTCPANRRWQPVGEHLREHPKHPLAAALSTALMVWLARTAYAAPDTNPVELIDSGRFANRAAVEKYLLEMLIPAVYQDQPPALLPGKATRTPVKYRPEDARRWLTFLATHLHRQGTHDLAWWQLYREVPPRVTNSVYGLAIGLLTGTGIGLGAYSAGLIAGSPALLLTVLGAGFLPAVMSGLVTGRAWRSQHTPGLADVQVRGRLRQLAAAIRGRVVFGLLMCMVIALVTVPLVSVDNGVIFGVGAGLSAMLPGAIADWLKAPVDELHTPSPWSVLSRDRIMSMVRGVTQGSGLALGIGLMVGTMLGFDSGLATGLVSAVAGLLTGGFDTAWGLFVIVRGWFWLRGQLPPRLMRFLADAHRRGILRQAGPVYQFRHARLQDHLASADRRCSRTSVDLSRRRRPDLIHDA